MWLFSCKIGVQYHTNQLGSHLMAIFCQVVTIFWLETRCLHCWLTQQILNISLYMVTTTGIQGCIISNKSEPPQRFKVFITARNKVGHQRTEPVVHHYFKLYRAQFTNELFVFNANILNRCSGHNFSRKILKTPCQMLCWSCTRTCIFYFPKHSRFH